jgi:trk system potassium uptake protein TrkA
VLRYVRRGAISALYTLREDFGELVEAEIREGSRLLLRPLDQLGLPKGMKVGAVVRECRVLFPRDDFKFQIGDHVIALVTYSYLKLAEALFGAAERPV